MTNFISLSIWLDVLCVLQSDCGKRTNNTHAFIPHPFPLCLYVGQQGFVGGGGEGNVLIAPML
jgi:hypothetical protein